MRHCMGKNLVVLIALILVTTVIATQIDPDYNYDSFCREFNRTYTGTQRSQHQQIFDDNLIQLKRRLANGERVMVTNFMDWNATQKSALLNFKPKQANVKVSSPPLRSSAKAAPATLDWKAKGAVTNVRNQGSCGSCWAFSSTATYQSMLAIEQNKKYDLAEQFAVQCDTSSSGCFGGLMQPALQLYVRQGIPLQSAFPYKQSSSYYGQSICSSQDTIRLSSKIKGVQHYENLSIPQIETQLANNGPLSVGIDGSAFAFMNVDSTGVITSCQTNPVTDHAVLLYGYNQTHWFIKNSWGTSWGDRGFGYVLKETAMDCGISTWLDQLLVEFRPPVMVELAVVMYDLGGDGWGGYEIGVGQDGEIVGEFGSEFTNGYKSQPVTIKIDQNKQTQIVVAQKGKNSNQIGFKILLSSNNKTLLDHSPGSSFPSSSIFTTFCLTNSCPQTPDERLFFTLMDSFGDGWGDNRLGLKKADGTFLAVLEQRGEFKSQVVGISVPRLERVEIGVVGDDQWSSEVGFSIKDSSGKLIASRPPGSSFKTGDILTSLCIGCTNVKATSPNEPTQVCGAEPSSDTAFTIATYVLAGIAGLLFGALIFVGVRLWKEVKDLKEGSESLGRNQKSSEPVQTTHVGSQNVAGYLMQNPLLSANPPPSNQYLVEPQPMATSTLPPPLYPILNEPAQKISSTLAPPISNLEPKVASIPPPPSPAPAFYPIMTEPKLQAAPKLPPPLSFNEQPGLNSGPSRDSLIAESKLPEQSLPRPVPINNEVRSQAPQFVSNLPSQVSEKPKRSSFGLM